MGNRRDLSGAITIAIALLLNGSGFLPQVAAQSSQLPTSIHDMIATRAETDALAGKPLSVNDFSRLFEDDLTKAQVSVREAFEHYEATYNAARASRPWWQSVKDLVPNRGWIVGAIALAYAVFKTQIETALKATVDWVVQAIYGRVAGYRIF